VCVYACARSLVVVLPLVEMAVLGVPDWSTGNDSNGSLQIMDGNQTNMALIDKQASFQWACSVKAGARDELVWLHNGAPVPLARSSSKEVNSIHLCSRCCRTSGTFTFS